MSNSLFSVIAILIPFAGTAVGAVCVFFLKRGIGATVRCMLSGFAAGVMTAASVWSLIIPAIECSSEMGAFAFFPATAGFVFGMVIFMFTDKLTTSGKIKSMTALVVTLHNFPEGMAVGVAVAGWLAQNGSITRAGLFTLSLGIAIQNIPEGAIVSMPLADERHSRAKCFLWGVLSGAVEPIGALCVLIATGIAVPILPYMLGFAAGAMIFTICEELVPEMNDTHRHVGTLFFTLGFATMMMLDVALG